MFIAQGTGDVTVNPQITVDFAKQLCAAGTPVTIKLLKNVSHSFAAEKSAYAAVMWMERASRAARRRATARGANRALCIVNGRMLAVLS